MHPETYEEDPAAQIMKELKAGGGLELSTDVPVMYRGLNDHLIRTASRQVEAAAELQALRDQFGTVTQAQASYEQSRAA